MFSARHRSQKTYANVLRAHLSEQLGAWLLEQQAVWILRQKPHRLTVQYVPHVQVGLEQTHNPVLVYAGPQ